MSRQSLAERIQAKNITIGVIGLGYVGLPVSIAFVNQGFLVCGFDIDHHRVERLQHGDSYVDDITNEELQTALQNDFTPHAEPDSLTECDVFIISVPTGFTDDEPDMSAVESAAKTVASHAPNRDILVIVSSTVYPGGTSEVVKPILELERTSQTYFAMVPERLNPGSDYQFADIPLVIGADSTIAREATTSLFNSVVSKTYPVSSTETAELTKTLENTYRMVNIALVNELITLAETLEADVWEAIDAAATKPFGFEPFQPGPGVGGHCIPIDPLFLSWRAKELGTDVSFLDDAHQINEHMPSFVANRLSLLLKARGIQPDQSSIVALGASYKPNVGDTRNSPALRVISELPSSADIQVVDPHTDPENVARKIHLSPEMVDLENADAVILLVDHDAFDLETIGNQSQFIFDTRNAMPESVAADVVRLGEMGGIEALQPRHQSPTTD